MKKTNNIYLLLCMFIFAGCLSGCSEKDVEQENSSQLYSISVPLSVDKGEVVSTKGVDGDGYPEGSYPLSYVYMWVAEGSSWKTLKIPCSEKNLSINVIENTDGTITVFQDNESITFPVSKEVRFVSQPDEVISLPESAMTTPGGQKTYKEIGDVIFVSSLTNYKYNSSLHTFVSGRTNISQAGLTMNRYSSTIYINMVVTSFDNSVEEGGTRTYSLSPEDWESLMGSPYTGWEATGFLKDYTYEYNLSKYAANDLSKSGIFTLEEGYVAFEPCTFTSTVSGQTYFYKGFGGHSGGYRFLFPTTTACYPCITFFDPLMGHATAILDDTPIVFGRNTTTVYDIIFDYKEVYYSWPVEYSLKSNKDNNFQLPIKKVFRNGKLIVDNE